MIYAITHYLPWLISTLQVYSSWLIGDKKLRGIKVGLVNQCFWSVWVVASSTWGLLPLNILLWVLQIRNYMKWKYDERDSACRTARIAVGGGKGAAPYKIDDTWEGGSTRQSLPDDVAVLSIHRVQASGVSTIGATAYATSGATVTRLPGCCVRQQGRCDSVVGEADK